MVDCCMCGAQRASNACLGAQECESMKEETPESNNCGCPGGGLGVPGGVADSSLSRDGGKSVRRCCRKQVCHMVVGHMVERIAGSRLHATEARCVHLIMHAGQRPSSSQNCCIAGHKPKGCRQCTLPCSRDVTMVDREGR